MYRHILIPTDGSELSQKAVEHGIALARSINANVTVMTVSTLPDAVTAELAMVTGTPKEYVTRVATPAQHYLDAAKDVAAAAGVRCDTVLVENEHPYQAIIDTAERKVCDLIVMASHGRHGLSVVVLGSEATKVLTHSAIPVLVFREPRRGAFVAAS